jgi:hypothetical protein
MSVPFGFSPSFPGPVTAQIFKDTVGTVRTIVVKTNGTTAVNVFGTTNGIGGTLVGMRTTAIGGTAATVTLRDNTESLVCAIAKGGTAGAHIGTAFSYVAFVSTGTMSLVSSVNGTDTVGGGNALVYVDFIPKVAEIA